MHKPSLAQIVHSTLFPRPRASDPATFSAHITRNLVPEVRIETSTFYGSLDCPEAQYPGLDYSYGPHRMRLGRFPWHRRLFRAFDELALTEAEISSLCRWEGTKSARERYEKEEGVKVRDTTADSIRPASPSPLPSIEVHYEDDEDDEEAFPEVDLQFDTCQTLRPTSGLIDDRGIDCIVEEKEEEDSSDDEMESCGVELNHRLMAATAAREQGDDVPLDEDWEQWLKEAGERGSYTDLLSAIRMGQPLSYLYDMPSSMPPLGRAGVRPSASLSEPFILPTPSMLSGRVPPIPTMIKAIFYSKFDTQEGPKVVHQVPDGAIVPSATAPSQPLFLTFSDVSFFVIPRQELCGNLIQVCTNGYRILGYPICMKSLRYDRNEFIFNFCVVLSEDEDFSTYKSVVQKLADLMHGLEEQNGFLSRDHSKSGEGKVYSLCETLMEDLNNYCECMIPIDELNTLNIKLFPVYPAPPPVKAWHVPLFTVRYQTFMDENWDLTMQRIVPHINGVNSVRIISILADTDFSLTCRAIRHLLYYGCLFLLDIFSFSAIYAPTAQFSSTIATDEDMQQECARYVNTIFASPITAASAALAPGYPPHYDPDAVWPPVGDPFTSSASEITIPSRSPSRTPSPSPSAATIPASSRTTSPAPATATDDDATTTTTRPTELQLVDGVGIVELYASLKQGQSIKQWYLQHSRKLTHIDIRRLITFGIIKGFLYRVHKYAYATGNPAPPLKSSHYHHASTTFHLPSGPSSRGPGTGANSPYASSAGDDPAPIVQQEGMGHPTSVYSGSRPATIVTIEGEEEEDDIDDKTLSKYLDGMHCFDQICTELEISERELTIRLKRFPGEVLILHR
ncbi:NPR2-domain-containing protein [Aspergillus sclerotiicarbonarius CBS 121057]|uniref:NPR2-domain-containing protein n=1 Tax=Aspergillus sclerotiicarbonarius (strain CBS 121057 / IBT 28362) TaxID=1448318 RepID=A0A319EMN9_ASPSB|nr:NPR2-domain-containing protein [Aspergillus sclerotiicarbonarius CBS 121057]